MDRIRHPGTQLCRYKMCCGCSARGEEGEEGVPGEPGVGQAHQEGHRQQEPLGPGQGDPGLLQEGVPRQGAPVLYLYRTR